MDAERIKNRDKWTCKRCGHKYHNLVVCQIGCREDDDGFITLCKECEEWSWNNGREAVALYKKLLVRNKVVLVGDCHGNFERLDRVLTDEEPFDFFLSVGDIGNLKDVTPDNIHIIDKWQGKGYFVRGNHDNVWFFNELGLDQEINGLHVAAFSGMLKTRTFLKEQPNNVSFREVLYLSHLKDVDILVTHQPPTGLFDNAGEAVLEEVLNYVVPKIYVSGHLHQYRLKFHLQTFVISLSMIHKGHVVAYFQGKDLRNIEVVLKKGKKVIRV